MLRNEFLRFKFFFDLKLINEQHIVSTLLKLNKNLTFVDIECSVVVMFC